MVGWRAEYIFSVVRRGGFKREDRNTFAKTPNKEQVFEYPG